MNYEFVISGLICSNFSRLDNLLVLGKIVSGRIWNDRLIMSPTLNYFANANIVTKLIAGTLGYGSKLSGRRRQRRGA